MVSAKKFEALALDLAGTEMTAHFDKQAFKKNNKIFATLHPESLVAMVKLSPEQQSVYLQIPGNIFYPASGTWGKNGYTHFNLKQVTLSITRELLALAWQNTGAKKS